MMSQRGIGSVGKPSLRYRVDRGIGAKRSMFETIGSSRREDLRRATLLRSTAKKYPETIDEMEALALAARLELIGEGGEVVDSLASSTYMRGQRRDIAGALWRLIRKSRIERVCGLTVIPRTWEVTAEGLEGVNPVKLLRAFLAALYDCGAGKAKGWIFAYLHGEWDPIGKVYRLHLHGFASGGMVAVIDRLRKLPNYKTQRFLKDGSPSPVYRRVRKTRKKLRNLPYPITYRMQSYWPAKALFISDDGARIRARRKQRIAEPQHSQVLLWLDRWGISDLTLMVGLRVTATGLKQTKPVS